MLEWVRLEFEASDKFKKPLSVVPTLPDKLKQAGFQDVTTKLKKVRSYLTMSALATSPSLPNIFSSSSLNKLNNHIHLQLAPRRYLAQGQEVERSGAIPAAAGVAGAGAVLALPLHEDSGLECRGDAGTASQCTPRSQESRDTHVQLGAFHVWQEA